MLYIIHVITFTHTPQSPSLLLMPQLSRFRQAVEATVYSGLQQLCHAHKIVPYHIPPILPFPWPFQPLFCDVPWAPEGVIERFHLEQDSSNLLFSVL